MSIDLQAFTEVNFNYVRSPDSIWKNSELEVPELNKKVLDQVIAEFFRQTRIGTDHAIGEVVVGTGGSGKTHLVGRLRQRTWEKGGWFVLLDIVGLKDFWKSAALCFAHALSQQMTKNRTQGQAVLAGVAKQLGIEHQLDAELMQPDLSLDNIFLINKELAKFDRNRARQHSDVLRALYLFCSDDFEASNLAYVWLQGLEAESDKAKSLGFATFQKSPVQLVEGLSWIMSLSGPTLVAVDNFDSIITPSQAIGSDFEPIEPDLLAKVLGDGLINLHDIRIRGMTVLSCTEVVWNRLLQVFTPPQLERFNRTPRVLYPLLSEDLTRRLILSRVKPVYEKSGYRPPYNTYPFTENAIASAAGLMPREILLRCEDHRRRCVDAEKLLVCDALGPTGGDPKSGSANQGFLFDEQFQYFKSSASIDGYLGAANSDAFGFLINDALSIYVLQSDVPGLHFECDSQADQQKPLLHGRLTITYLLHNDDQRNICFRAIEHTHWNAFQARLGAAVTAAGMDAKRTLFIVRRAPMPNSTKMAQLVEAFYKAGGKVINPSDDDLETLSALCSMRETAANTRSDAPFEAWLRDRQPLCDTDFFKKAGLCPVPRHWNDVAPLIDVSAPDVEKASFNAGPIAATVQDAKKAENKPISTETLSPPSPSKEAFETPRTDEGWMPRDEEPFDSIPIGNRLTADAEPVSLPISILPRHTAIIAGAGSGKTVLLRRIVEEAALAGIPAIVIDPNNDLSRLGDPWPSPPEVFTPEDTAKAARYHESVEVVIWTPGIHAGNPLFLSVLPDFSALGDDPDERGQAVTMAADTLGPLAAAKTTLKKGVLSDALRAFATKGGSLQDMIGFLEDLPEGVSSIGNASTIAAKMADELKASIATNPLLKATGPVLDPKLLFFGKDPARTRVSVINLSGLASDEAKQDFVNRLQMTLFGWIKKHPSPKGMLYVIDEAQNFIPSGAGALSKTSGVQLVAQARKYGLGMIVVTQAPKGIDNKVVSNCTTQFLGKQNAPTDQATVKEMVAATGGKADDIGKLNQGQFYFKTEASGKPVKIKTPICLTHHPANPPTPDEVVARAKRSAP